MDGVEETVDGVEEIIGVLTGMMYLHGRPGSDTSVIANEVVHQMVAPILEMDQMIASGPAIAIVVKTYYKKI